MLPFLFHQSMKISAKGFQAFQEGRGVMEKLSSGYLYCNRTYVEMLEYRFLSYEPSASLHQKTAFEGFGMTPLPPS
jgi:hypothetical protein